MKPQHYLISLDIIPQRYRIHGYLMTDDRRCVENAVERIVDEAEKEARKYGYRVLPMVLVTSLTGQCRKTVRDIVCKHHPQCKQKLREAKEYHLTAWSWDVANPDDARLMELH